mgnify:CR=1 FL=1
MSDSRSISVIAIDGGGTRCRVALDDRRSITTVETGPANASTDLDGTVQQITEGLAELANRTDRTIAVLSGLPAFIGLAGVTGRKIADQLRDALPFRRVRIEVDRAAALRGALGHKDGVIAHCGTGSFFAAQTGGKMRFAGGWGPILGDVASAQWIGRSALSVTLESVDGRRETAPLAERLLADLGGTAGIVHFAASALPSDFGALAPLVTRHAEDGDALANQVMRAGAEEIARALLRIGWQPGRAICLTGGIAPRFGPYLPADMQADLTPPESEPLAGALSMARDLALEAPDDRS